MGTNRIALPQRFHARHESLNPDECWEWQGCRNKQGYGMIMANGKFERAHRVSFMLKHGYMPKDFVCHTCDNPPCVNPAHLVEADRAWNMNDMKIKGRGRGAQGQANGNSKLTEEQVSFIRSSNLRQRKLSEILGVSRSLISLIRSRKIWCRAKAEEPSDGH